MALQDCPQHVPQPQGKPAHGRDARRGTDACQPTAADSSFEHQSLYLALRTLPPKERSAITLYYLSGYDIKEIAAITDVSEDAVKKQLSRGRDKLKEKLKL